MSLLSFTLATVANPDSAAKPVPLRIPMAARAQHDDIIAKAIEARKLQVAGRHSHRHNTGNPHARFESHEASDENRRRARLGMRKLRMKKCLAEPAKPCKKKRSAAKPASKQQRRILRNCCGRRPENCRCFTQGRGLELAKSFKRKRFKGELHVVSRHKNCMPVCSLYFLRLSSQKQVSIGLSMQTHRHS